MTGSPPSRTPSVVACLGLVAVPFLWAGTPGEGPATVADANQCESLTGAVVSDWNQNVRPDIEEIVEGVEGAGRLVRTTERASVGAQLTRAATGRTPSQHVGQVMQDAVNALVGAVSAGPWSQIGPQALDLPGTASGRITPVVGTTRMFITPPNLTHDGARVTITKIDGRQRAEVVVCKAPWDNPGNYTRVRVVEFDRGLSNVGQSRTVNLPNTYGWYYTIKVRKFVGANAFEYRVQTRTTGQSRLD